MDKAKIQSALPVEFRTFDNLGKSDAEVSALLVQIGQRGELDAEHAEVAAQCILKTRETYPGARLVLTVMGFDDDKRELWEVPEVCEYMLLLCDAVFADWPNGSPFDLNLDDTSLTMVLLCTGIMRVTGRDMKTGNYTLALAL